MTILCYHEVGPGWASPLATDPGSFAEQCAWLAARKNVLPLDRAVGRLDRSGRLPAGETALTFDDGFRGLYDHAFPVLRRTGLPATVFLVARTLTGDERPPDWVDTPPEGRSLETLTVDQVHEMQEAGIRFGSHSYAHADLTALGFEECVRDLRDSRLLLETLLGGPVPLLAYPRGRHNPVVRRAAEAAGYRHAFTLPERREATGPYAVPRVGLYRGNTLAELRVKSARAYLPVRTAPVYQLARAAVRTARRAS
ncbi:MAG TPA: polysaccharide deacetylase family protein [Nocardioidaceae bacterium]|nr:polysaccharide deacetylase family protein [Nocardioidaceae bacterium]